MVSVKINNQLTEIASQLTVNNNRKENTDYGAMKVLSTKSSRYEPYSVVDIDDGNGNTYQLLVESDSVLTYKGSLYEHELTLIEPIAILSTVYPVDRSFTTVPAKTIGEILAIYKQELDFYQGFDLVYDDSDSIYDETMVNKEYGSVSMAEVIYDLFRSIDAIPRLAFDNGRWLLTYDPYTKRGNALTLSVDAEQKDVNDIDYATEVMHKSRNVSVENKGIWYPSRNNWMTPRIKGTIIKTSELQYELDSDIEVLYKVEAKTTANINEIYEEDFPEITSPFEVLVDITPRVKFKEDYDALVVNGDYFKIDYSPYYDRRKAPFYKENCIYYTKDNNIIDGLFSVQSNLIIFQKNINHIHNAILAEFRKSLEEQYPQLTSDRYYTPVDYDPEDIELRVLYRPKRDVDFVTQRQDTKDFYKSTVLNNQKDTRVNLQKLLENADIYVNRIGSQVVSLTQAFDITDDYWQLGDYYLLNDEYWLAVDITYSFDRDNVVCKADFVKNFANINRETAISREPSPYVYTGKRLQSNFILKEYLIFGENSYSESNNLTDDAKRTALNVLDYDSDYNEPLSDFLMYNYFTERYIHAPTLMSGSGNTLLVHVAFKSPQIAGNALQKIGSAWYKAPVIYTDNDDDFTLNLLEMSLANGYTALDDTSNFKYYPIVDSSFDKRKTGLYSMPINKDTNDSLAITWQLLVKSVDKDIIVPNGFSKLNNLIRYYEEVPTIKVYTRATPYGVLDKKVTDDDSESTASIAIDMDESTITIDEELTYWALAIDEELVLCANNTTVVIPFTFSEYINYKAYDVINLVLNDIEIDLTLNVSHNRTIQEYYVVAPEIALEMSMANEQEKEQYTIYEVVPVIEIEPNIDVNVNKFEFTVYEVQPIIELENDMTLAVNKFEFTMHEIQPIIELNVQTTTAIDDFEYIEVIATPIIDLSNTIETQVSKYEYIQHTATPIINVQTNIQTGVQKLENISELATPIINITTSLNSVFANTGVKQWTFLYSSLNDEEYSYDEAINNPTYPEVSPGVSASDYDINYVVRTSDGELGSTYYWYKVINNLD